MVGHLLRNCLLSGEKLQLAAPCTGSVGVTKKDIGLLGCHRVISSKRRGGGGGGLDLKLTRNCLQNHFIFAGLGNTRFRNFDSFLALSKYSFQTLSSKFQYCILFLLAV